MNHPHCFGRQVWLETVHCFLRDSRPCLGGHFWITNWHSKHSGRRGGYDYFPGTTHLPEAMLFMLGFLPRQLVSLAVLQCSSGKSLNSHIHRIRTDGVADRIDPDGSHLAVGQTYNHVLQMHSGILQRHGVGTTHENKAAPYPLCISLSRCPPNGLHGCLWRCLAGVLPAFHRNDFTDPFVLSRLRFRRALRNWHYRFPNSAPQPCYLTAQANQFALVLAKLRQLFCLNPNFGQALILGLELFQFGKLSGLLAQGQVLPAQCLVGRR